jgi:hypothetical protein
VLAQREAELAEAHQQLAQLPDAPSKPCQSPTVKNNLAMVKQKCDIPPEANIQPNQFLPANYMG